MAGARSRWKGAQAELRDLLCPLVTNRSFVRYDESEQQNKTVTDPKLIGEHHTLLGVLHGAQPNFLSFNKNDIQAALRLLVVDPSWG